MFRLLDRCFYRTDTRGAPESTTARSATSDVAAGDALRRLHVVAGVDRDRQPDQLGVRPGQRGRRGRSGAGLEALLARRRVLVPDLLGEEAALVCGAGHVPQTLLGRGRLSGGELVLPALAGQDRPGPADRGERVGVADVPLRAVGLLAVAV